MATDLTGDEVTLGQLARFFRRILGPEKDFYYLAIIYGVGISLLSLATPISVQMLINTVANTGLTTPLVVLSATLFILLLASGLLNALRVHLMEIFGRRFYARMVSEISLRSIFAQNPYFNDDGRGPLFNRYFDIITVQKTIPVLLIGGFTLILQAGVGFVLVSLYHPLFLAFNIVIVLSIWVIWLIWGRGAVRAAIELSHRKHKAAAWLEGLGESNGFFKSDRHVAYALKATDKTTGSYVDQHRSHFRLHFAQTISFLILYAAASAMLLGLGGWLVIQGQLTLGQLVAAELVLSAAFFGVSQLGTYLTYFYDLCAAVEELSLFYNVPQEEPTGAPLAPRKDASLTFVNAGGDARGVPAKLTFEIPSGANVMALACNHGVQRMTTSLLRRHLKAQGGYVAFGGGDILAADAHHLRREIILLDRPSIIETTIREYLNLSADNLNANDLLNALRAVGLEPIVAQLKNGLDTEIAKTGWPLSLTETMQLKLAAAILAKPRVLILNQLYDLMPEECLKSALAALRAETEMTFVYFSHRRRNFGFDLFLFLENEKQTLFDNFEDFQHAIYGPQASASPASDAIGGVIEAAVNDAKKEDAADSVSLLERRLTP
ncbi:MAG: ABC transporter ATP-binding protein [Pseudomonadota bacterium]